MVSFRPFLLGAFAVAMAYAMSPEIKKRVKPAFDKGIEKGKEKMAQIKYKMEKSAMMEEEPANRQSIDEELERLREERKTYLEEIRELKNLVNKLFGEIAQLKGKS
ncbi:MAG: hypothetical protein PWP45_1709 [Tepidanaerobacteraceae bacterium]|nr:hypothetical protein [Tepidanaerobacteraceae bacterium]